MKAESNQLGFKTTVPDTDDISNSLCSPLSFPFPLRKNTQLPHSALFPSASLTRQWQRRRKAEPKRDRTVKESTIGLQA